MIKINTVKLLKPEVYTHPCRHIELVETHISWVILTGDYAYKIKKPVNFGFLDFSTLDKRKHYCEQELHLNRRLAATLYLSVVEIKGTPDKPHISGSGKTFEYAIKMKQFPQSAQLDNMLAADELTPEHMDAIARMTADFHQHCDIADDTKDFGNEDAVYQPVKENFRQIKQHLSKNAYSDTLSTLEQWNEKNYTSLKKVFTQRKNSGFIRECHGDMHLRNLLWLNGKAMAFDCIEFNPQLRWIDVISEIAFLIMDLQARKEYRLANRFLNTYLEITGDYTGLSILTFYLCYRALVRAKVCVLRAEQKSITRESMPGKNTAEKEACTKEVKHTLTEFESYLNLANSYIKTTSPMMIITRGPSASGKSNVSQRLADTLGLIRIRSDVERKRLFNIDSTTKTVNDIDTGIYSSHASHQTYTKLAELATDIVQAGYSVIIDAAFLKHEQRKTFQSLAHDLSVPYTILETTAPEEVLRERIINRKNDVSDADLAVLNEQLKNWQALHEDEKQMSCSIDTSQPFDIDTLIADLNNDSASVTIHSK